MGRIIFGKSSKRDVPVDDETQLLHFQLHTILCVINHNIRMIGILMGASEF